MTDIPLPATITVPIQQHTIQRRRKNDSNGNVVITKSPNKSNEMNVLQNTTNTQSKSTKQVAKASIYARMYDKDDDNDTTEQQLTQPIQIGTIDALNNKPQQYIDTDITNIRAKHTAAPTTQKQNRHVFMSDNGASILSQQHNKQQTVLDNDSDDELNTFAKPFAVPSASIQNIQSNNTKPTVTITRSTVSDTLFNDISNNTNTQIKDKTTDNNNLATDGSDVEIAFDDLAATLLPITPVSTSLTPSRKGHNRQLTPAITDIITVETPKRTNALPLLEESDDYSDTYSQQSSVDSTVSTTQPSNPTVADTTVESNESSDDTVSDTLMTAPVVERKLSSHRRTATPQVNDLVTVEPHSTQPTVQTITEEYGHNRTATPNVSDIVTVAKATLKPTTSMIQEESESCDSSDTSPMKSIQSTEQSTETVEIDDEFNDAYNGTQTTQNAVKQAKQPRKLLKPSKQQLAKESGVVTDTNDDLALLDNNNTTVTTNSVPSATFGNMATNNYADGLNVLNKYAAPVNSVATVTATVTQSADEFADIPPTTDSTVTRHKATTNNMTARNITIKYTDALKQINDTVDVDQHITHIVTSDIRKLSFFTRLAYKLSKPTLKSEQLRNQLNIVFATAATKFDQSIVLHDQILCSVYRVLSGNTIAPNMYGEHWSFIGFQSNDPSTDTRSSGLLGILQMLYLCNNHTQLILNIHQLSNDGKQHFPLAITLFQLTGMVLQTLRECKLYARINKCDDVFIVCNELFAALTHRFYTLWKQRQCTISSFNDIKQQICDECRNDPIKLIKQFESISTDTAVTKTTEKVEFVDL